MTEMNIYYDMLAYDIEHKGFAVSCGWLHERWDRRYYLIKTHSTKGHRKELTSIIEVDRYDVPQRTRSVLDKYSYGAAKKLSLYIQRRKNESCRTRRF